MTPSEVRRTLRLYTQYRAELQALVEVVARWLATPRTEFPMARDRRSRAFFIWGGDVMC